jgi:hypothetical protein
MVLLRLRGNNLAISRSPVVISDGQNVLMFPHEDKFRSAQADSICFTNALTAPKIPDLDYLHEFNTHRSFIVRVVDFFCADPMNCPQARSEGLYPLRLAEFGRVACSAIGSSLESSGDSSGAP